MNHSREFSERPVVGVGGVVIEDGRALLVRRGSEPLKGQWSIPGGTLELGETLAQGVVRELREETGLEVRVLDLIEVFERIFPEGGPAGGLSAAQRGAASPRPRYHFVVIDYLCERSGGELRAGSDVTEVALVREDELSNYRLTEAATRVLRKAFAMARARHGKS
jgi:ADP-ribose pyrophosphatase YjhB (NUDIX family)